VFREDGAMGNTYKTDIVKLIKFVKERGVTVNIQGVIRRLEHALENNLSWYGYPDEPTKGEVYKK